MSFGADGTRLNAPTYARSLKKRNLLLVFYRTGTCSVCVHQLVELAEMQKEILRWNTATLAMSVDDAILQAKTKEKIAGAFPLLIDPDGKTVHAFDVYNPSDRLARPAVFLIGPNLKILYHYVGQSIGDRPSRENLMHAVKYYSGLLPLDDKPSAKHK